MVEKRVIDLADKDDKTRWVFFALTPEEAQLVVAEGYDIGDQPCLPDGTHLFPAFSPETEGALEALLRGLSLSVEETPITNPDDCSILLQAYYGAREDY